MSPLIKGLLQLLVFLPPCMSAQNAPKGCFLSLKPYIGYQFENKVDYKSNVYLSADLLYGLKTGKQSLNPYDKTYNYPEYGIGLSYTGMSMVKLPEPSYLKDFYSIYLYFGGNLIGYDRSGLSYMLEFGPALSLGRYDPLYNPDNYYVSSPLMAHIAGGFQVWTHLGDRFRLSANLRLRHFSNGRVALPNQGLNMVETGIGLRYIWQTKKADTERVVPDASAPQEVSWKRGLVLHLGLGGGLHGTEAEWLAYNEKVPSPKDRRRSFSVYPRFSLSSELLYRYDIRFATGVGTDIFYAPDLKQLEADERLAFGDAAVDAGDGYSPLSVGFSLCQEIYYRDFSAFLAVGMYAFERMGIGNDVSWNYQRAGLRRYFRLPFLGNSDIYIGIAVKAQDFRASEYIEFSVGIGRGL